MGPEDLFRVLAKGQKPLYLGVKIEDTVTVVCKGHDYYDVLERTTELAGNALQYVYNFYDLDHVRIIHDKLMRRGVDDKEARRQIANIARQL